jgi:hypothetical protein
VFFLHLCFYQASATGNVPADVRQMLGLPAMGMGGMQGMGMGGMMGGMGGGGMGGGGMGDPSTKTSRELFIGNTPHGVGDKQVGRLVGWLVVR